jgi:hypothetical protein
VNLKGMFLGVFSLLLGLYCIADGIRMYKQKIIISHTSEREKYGLPWGIYFLLDINFIDKYRVDLTALIIGIIPIVFFALYLIYSRLNDVKYRIYNVDEDIYKEVIKKTLNENLMEFSITNGLIEVKGTPMYIEFIEKGFLLKGCKRVPNYQNFLKEIETNLENAEFRKKKRDWVTAIIGGIFFIIFSILFLSPLLLSS